MILSACGRRSDVANLTRGSTTTVRQPSWRASLQTSSAVSTAPMITSAVRGMHGLDEQQALVAEVDAGRLLARDGLAGRLERRIARGAVEVAVGRVGVEVEHQTRAGLGAGDGGDDRAAAQARALGRLAPATPTARRRRPGRRRRPARRRCRSAGTAGRARCRRTAPAPRRRWRPRRSRRRRCRPSCRGRRPRRWSRPGAARSGTCGPPARRRRDVPRGATARSSAGCPRSFRTPRELRCAGPTELHDRPSPSIRARRGCGRAGTRQRGGGPPACRPPVADTRSGPSVD